jgi:hypothetical protein
MLDKDGRDAPFGRARRARPHCILSGDEVFATAQLTGGILLKLLAERQELF